MAKLYFCLVLLVFIRVGEASNVVRFGQLSLAADNTSVQVVREIVQDKQGFIWIATGYQGLYKYDGYTLNPIHLNADKQRLIIHSIAVDLDGRLWVGTEKKGLYSYYAGKILHYEYSDTANTISSNYIMSLLPDEKGGVWIGTNKGFDYISKERVITRHIDAFQNSDGLQIKAQSLLLSDEQTLLIGTDIGLFSYAIETNHVVKYQDQNTQVSVNSLFVDSDNSLWVGTDYGLLRKLRNADLFERYLPNQLKGRIFSITGDTNNLWVGTLFNGLFKISSASGKIDQYQYSAASHHSISDNSILSLMLDNTGMLWIGTFNAGLNFSDSKAAFFGLEDDSKFSLDCATTKVFYHFYEDKQTLWIASEDGVVKYNAPDGSCDHYSGDFSHPLIYHLRRADESKLWVSTARGLNVFDSESGEVDQLLNVVPRTNTYFTEQYNPSTLLLGTSKGLFTYDVVEKKATKVPFRSTPSEQVNFYAYVLKPNNEYIFATNQGIYQLGEDGYLELNTKIQSQLPTFEIMSLHLDKKGQLWIGSFLYGLHLFDSAGEHLRSFGRMQEMPENVTINSILSDGQEHIWMGSDQGLINVNTDTQKAHIFRKNDGLQSDYFIKNAAIKTTDGKLIFGGRNGFNAFHPEHIQFNKKAPPIVLTAFSHFGEVINAGDEHDAFKLSSPINFVDELTLTHRDYVIGFEFAALDFSDPNRNQYAYMMEGLDPNWNYTDASNRRASYTNLKAGEYLFKVKGSNKDGVWSKDEKIVAIKVLPPPWLSWWAIACYFVLFFGVLYWYIQRKNRASMQANRLLKAEVNKRTEELVRQKHKIEQLLLYKNEFFTHLSHELRTPLTLILGPINKLLDSGLPKRNIDALDMVKRNTDRLLTLIEQLLQMAKVSHQKDVILTPQPLQEKLLGLVDSFQLLAQAKRITLGVLNNPAIAVMATDDAIDCIVGNVLSNAIKYTPQGGQVTLDCEETKTQVIIHISDTGSGLSEQDQSEIFNHFKRLDSHQNIEGVGIGLSIVKEVVELNQGSIEINSELGVGSTFSISLHKASETKHKDTSLQAGSVSHPLVRQLTQPQEMNTHEEKKIVGNNAYDKVLIIDDNQDMRLHIAECLKSEYYCLLAASGKEGIGLAIKQVPDVIVCDVMMPEMNGFEVSRILRSDSRTSHIPLILLTALSDQKNRIRGWREHVDAYLNKPFDEKELLAQIESVLVIRNILKTKASEIIAKGNDTQNLNLPHKDQQFVDKLIQLIAKKYSDVNYLRAQMAQDMAVSERQLQRKLKALIDKNPMDLLREYRLDRAIELLKQGHRINQVSDTCGFSSASYFSKCFKAKYDMSPKHYQDICNKKE